MKRIAASLSILLGFVASGTSALSQEIHTYHCLHGCPTGTPHSNDLIVREIYTLSSNDMTRFADWVAYRVSAETIGGTEERHWRPDPWLDDIETLEPDDFDGAHHALSTDRGHQVPLAAFTGTTHWEDTNFLSNITPQRSSLNRGPWMRLEGAVRAAAGSGTDIYVVGGPLFEAPQPPMPQAEPHIVPSGYWKVIVTPANELAAFIFPQDTSQRADFCDFRASLAEVEQRAQLDLFPRFGSTAFLDGAEVVGCSAGAEE